MLAKYGVEARFPWQDTGSVLKSEPQSLLRGSLS